MIPTPPTLPIDHRSPLASMTLKGAVAMAIAYAASRIGVHVPEGALAGVADAVIDLVFMIGMTAVGIGRARAHTPLK